MSWVVPSIIQQQQYYVIYGLSSSTLDETSATVTSVSDITLTDQQYSVGLTELSDSTMYYFRVVAEFGDIVLMSDINTFRTQDQRENFNLICCVSCLKIHVTSYLSQLLVGHQATLWLL